MTSTALTPLARSRPVMRYAPSPTGDLHLGNLKTAIEAWEDCRRRDGLFILRIEDIDAPRTVAGSESRLVDDLRWLGLDWDEGPDIGGPAGSYRQSERTGIYEAALEKLEQASMAYLCTCSRKDLREASAPHDREASAYPGTCKEKPAAEQALHPAGAAVRLRLDRVFGRDAVVEFTDEIRGLIRADLNQISGDFIIRRRDGLWAYQLACALDDALMGVTHVLRGEDLLDSTPRQIAVLRALGLPVPQYAHVPLLADAEGRRLSKRDGSNSLRDLRMQGLGPDQVRELIDRMPRVDSKP